MRLTKLELHGFKSFADTTELVFEPGVTAIVGPNGCGKSNVSDAVRWVLGEQRARLLRGAKMEEVIFQGSSARRAGQRRRGLAAFLERRGVLPVPFQEVVITRRLSRSGESEYFLNRAPCRLRDIADLLRGTGLGADTGVVIESKMIDALLSDRPDDRRELFEEAAGVGLYRDRRRTTERRLEETTVDLQRLDDLISEVRARCARSRASGSAPSGTPSSWRAGSRSSSRSPTREMEAWREELQRLDERVAELREQLPPAEEAVRRRPSSARDAAHGARAAAEAQRTELSRLVIDAARASAADPRRDGGGRRAAAQRARAAPARRARGERGRGVRRADHDRSRAGREASAHSVRGTAARRAREARAASARGGRDASDASPTCARALEEAERHHARSAGSRPSRRRSIASARVTRATSWPSDSSSSASSARS